MAALVKVIYKNRGLDATWTATESYATLPVANLADPVRSKVWRAPSATGTQTLKAKLGAAYAIGGLALVGSNITTDSTITIQANSSDSWGSPAFTSSITPWDAGDSGVMVVYFGAAQTYQWWRVMVTNMTNPDGYIEIGVVVLGPVLSMATAPESVEYGPVDPSITAWSAAGTPRTWELPIFSAMRFPFTLLPESLAFGDLQTALRDMGARRDVVVSLYADGPSADAISKATNLYGRLTSLTPARSRGPVSRWDWDAEFRESL